MYDITKRLELGVEIFKLLGFNAKIPETGGHFIEVEINSDNEGSMLDKILTEANLGRRSNTSNPIVKLEPHQIMRVGMFLEETIPTFNLDKLSGKFYITQWEPINQFNVGEIISLTLLDMDDKDIKEFPAIFKKLFDISRLTRDYLIIDSEYDIFSNKVNLVVIECEYGVFEKAILKTIGANRGRKEVDIILTKEVHQLFDKGITFKTTIEFHAPVMDMVWLINEVSLHIARDTIIRMGTSSSHRNLPAWMEELKTLD